MELLNAWLWAGPTPATLRCNGDAFRVGVRAALSENLNEMRSGIDPSVSGVCRQRVSALEHEIANC